ncbi:hypothetical protein [Achromobacter kerstersii]|jgi:hypothetical protein
MKTSIIVLATAAALAGCAHQVDSSVRTRAEAPLVCAEPQCGRYWDAAQTWLVQNSSYKLQTVTTSVIQTYGPTPNSPLLAYTIIKEPGQYGTYSIKIAANCANMFGCQPNALHSIAAFKDYMLALP